MKRDKKEILFYVDTTSWVVPALIGVILLVLSAVFKQNFFYVPYYLLMASIVSYLLKFRRYGILTSSQLVLYFGTFLKRKIVLSVNDIESVNPETTKFEGFLGRQRHTYKIKSLVINLRESLNEDDVKRIIGEKQLKIIHRRVELSDEGKKLILYHPPEGGFQHFLNKISEAIGTKNNEPIVNESKFAEQTASVLLIFVFTGLFAINFLFKFGG